MLSGDEPSLFRELHCLCAPLRVELVEDTSRVRLDGVLADVEPLGDLAVAQPGGNQLEDLQLAPSDAQLLLPSDVWDEGEAGRRGDLDRDRNLPDDDSVAGSGQLESKPDPEGGEDERHDPPVHLDRVLEDEEP